MATKIMLACLCFLLLAACALAQTITAVDANGNTIVEVVTIDPQLGVPTTQIVQTLAAGAVTTPPVTPTATPTTAAPTLVATTQAPDGQQGPVGAPAPINGPVSTYVYTYTTTDAAGDFTALVDTYTATAPASVPFTPTGTGTILNFSAYLSMIGTNTVAPDFSASSRTTVPRSLWLGTAAMALGLAGGFGLRVKLATATSKPVAKLEGPEVLVAIAFLVDSSVLISTDWEQLFKEYASHLLTRLFDLYGINNNPFRIGFVCYAPPSTQPIPLLSRTFFTSPPALFKDLTSNPSIHGVGHTGNGGGKGMAVLEGLVAVLELFDRLKETAQHKTDAVHIKAHVIHLAACQPDTAERPMWNVSPALDTVTWESIPSEFRKRDINYSLIQLRHIPRLDELFTSIAAAGSQEPWFRVRPGHSVRLMGYPIPPPKPVTAAKRAIESNSSPDSKRQKASHPQPSPRISHATSRSQSNTPKLAPAHTKKEPTTPQVKASPITSNPPPPPLAPVPPQPQPQPQSATTQAAPGSSTFTPQLPPAQIQTQPQPITPTTSDTSSNTLVSQIPPAIAKLTPDKLRAMMERLNIGERKVIQQARMATVAESEGRHEEAKKIRDSLQNTMISIKKLKELLTASMNQLKMQQQQQQHPSGEGSAGGSGSSGTAQPGSASQAMNISPKKEPTTLPTPVPQPIPPTAVPITVPTTVPLPHASPQRPAAQPHIPLSTQQTGQGPAPSNMVPPQASPLMAAQMQKLIEQRNRATPHMPPANAPTVDQPGLASTSAPPQAPVGGAQGQSSHWKGLLTWSGSDSGTHARKNMQASVAMLPNRNGEPVDFTTWPASMAISPSRERAVSLTVLQEWLRKHKCSLLSVNPLPQSLEMKAANEESFKTLFRLLNEKGIYAVAAWNAENGPMENRVLIFPARMQLFAAFFPTPGGMPELPKPPVDVSQNPQMAKIKEIFSRLTREQQSSLMAQPPERRIAWIQTLAMRSQQAHLLQQQQQQQQQTPQPSQPSPQPQFSQQAPTLAAMQAMSGSGTAFQQQVGNSTTLNAGIAGMMQPQHPQTIPPGAQMMNYGTMGVPPHTQGGMHQRTPSGNSMMPVSLPPGVTMEMMQALIGNRNGG